MAISSRRVRMGATSHSGTLQALSACLETCPLRPANCRDLAEGWVRLRTAAGGDEARVHLVTNQVASSNDRVAGTSRHFRTFVARALRPLARGESPETGWEAIIERLIDASALDAQLGVQFLRALDLDLGADRPLQNCRDSRLPEAERSRSSQIIALSNALFCVVSGAPGPVELTRKQI